MGLFSNSQYHLLESSLDASALRQKVIANNVANVDTPNFKRSDVHFEEILQRELEATKSAFVGYRTDPRHLMIGGSRSVTVPQPAIVRDKASAMNNNGNNVDIDAEMALLAKNQIEYYVLIGQMNHEMKQLHTAIGGGR